jgi:hypothetical protein
MIFNYDVIPEQVEYYYRLLTILGSLSNLFSNSAVPYLDYRISEKLFCRTFNANDLGRSDISVDAKKDYFGIGIKTFIEGNGESFQKIAEFNKDSSTFRSSSPEKLIKTVANLRNKRIESTKGICGVSNLFYHCIVRKPEKMKVYEIKMDNIKEDDIQKIRSIGNVIKFTDSLNQYSYNLTKSTLYQQFITPSSYVEIDIEILENPFKILETLLGDGLNSFSLKPVKIEEYIYLPLYSDRTKKVETSSGLNQWNAKGRPRDPDEVYIPIPKWIHKQYPNFFPTSDNDFELVLPDATSIVAKVCQDNGKALMSNPNKDLGKWLLRDVFKLKEREILTTEKLQEIGLDSVIIHKIDNNKFSINFKKIGSFEEFKVSVQR